MAVEFLLLGAVEARVDDRPVDLGHARQQCVLVVLLIEANKPVSPDQLLDRAWGNQLPKRGRGTLYSYLSRLRRDLEPVPGARIARRSGGYALEVDPMTVDLHRFHQLVDQGRAADDDEALTIMETALGLWRGEAFVGLSSPWLDDLRATLERERLALELDRTDLLLRRGQHGEQLAELMTRARAYPLDERLAGQVMLALYLSGRQGEALDHYRQLRIRLAESLGADPGIALRQLHQRILAADPSLTPPACAGTRTPTPRQLPALPRLFTGREEELARLTETVNASGGGGVMVIWAIGGSGGIGKTWLAVCWAHRNLHRFPDGQLYVDLNGFDPTGEPVAPDVAVRGFLEALGVHLAAIPGDPQAGTGLYRSLVAGRRMLIVLDNAHDTAQVTPLLPGDSACVVLVTSRSRLDGLVTAHGATPLALDVLPEDEAQQLLARYVGEERVTAEPDAATELLAHCAGLPLAIGILAARAATTPTLSLAALAEELRDRSARLDTMSTGELTTTLRHVFSGSYHALSGTAASLFRLLGLAQLPDIGVAGAASLVGVPVARARGPLRELEAAHLVRQHVPNRYRMHDLIRLYAGERAANEEHDRVTPLRRLVDHYLHTAHAADRLLYPHRSLIALDPPLPGGEPERLGDAAAARAWFDREYACLTLAQRQAAQHGWHAPLWQLAWVAHVYRQLHGHLHDNVEAGLAGVEAADRVSSTAIRATTRLHLAQALTDLGRLDEARAHLTRALALAKTAADTRAVSRSHWALAQTWALQGNNREALAHATAGIEVGRTLANPRDLAIGMGYIGWLQAHLGRYEDARSYCEVALTLNRELSQPDVEASNLDTLGYIAHQTGELRDALRYYRDALKLTREIGNTYVEANALEHLGETHAALRQPAEARHAWRTAVDLFRAQHRIPQAERVQRWLRDL